MAFPKHKNTHTHTSNQPPARNLRPPSARKPAEIPRSDASPVAKESSRALRGKWSWSRLRASANLGLRRAFGRRPGGSTPKLVPRREPLPRNGEKKRCPGTGKSNPHLVEVGETNPPRTEKKQRKNICLWGWQPPRKNQIQVLWGREASENLKKPEHIKSKSKSKPIFRFRKRRLKGVFSPPSLQKLDRRRFG